MTDLEKVFEYSKAIEKALELKFGAEGRGLHEKVSSVKGDIPDHIVKKIRFIASVRNKLAHEDGYKLDADNFYSSGDEVLDFLRAKASGKEKTREVGIEASIRKSLRTLLIPSAVIFAILGGGGGLSVGIGAGIVGAAIGAAFGGLLFCKEAVDFYISSFYITLALSVVGGVIALVFVLWDVGGLG